MNIQELRDDLLKQIGDHGQWNIAPGSIYDSNLDSLLAELPGGALSLAHVMVGEIKDKHFAATGKLGGDESWLFSELSPVQIQLDAVELQIEESGDGFLIKPIFQALFAQIPVTIALSEGGAFRLAPANKNRPSPAGQLVQLLGKQLGELNSLISVKSLSDLMGSMVVEELELVFDPKLKGPHALACEISFGDSRWRVLPNTLTLNNLSLGISLAAVPLGGSYWQTTFAGRVQARLDMGSDRWLDAALELDDDHVFTLSIQGSNGFPAIADVPAILGLGDLRHAIQSAFDQLGIQNPNLEELRVELAADQTFSLHRAYAYTKLEIKGIPLDARLTLPDLGLVGRMSEGSLFDVGKVVKSFGLAGLPESLGALRVSQFEVSAGLDPLSFSIALAVDSQMPLRIIPNEDRFAVWDLQLYAAGQAGTGLSGRLTGHFKLGNETVLVKTLFGGEEKLLFRGQLDYVDLRTIASQFRDTVPDELPEIELQNTLVELGLSGFVTFESSVTVDFAKLAAKYKIPLPEGLAEFELTRLKAAIDLAKGSWSIEFLSDKTYQFPDGSRNHVGLDSVRLKLFNGGTSAVAVEFSMTMNGAVSPTDSLRIQVKNLECSWASETSTWSCNQDVSCLFFGQEYAFKANIGGDTSSKRFELQYTSPINLVLIDPLAGACIHGLKIFAGSVTSDSGVVEKEWGVEGDCTFNLAPIFKDTPATMSLQSGDAGSSFKMAVGRMNPVPIDLGLKMQMVIGLDPFEIEYAGRSAEKKNAGWRGKGGGELSFRNVVKGLERYFPIESIGIEICVDEQDVSIQAKDFAMQFDFPALRAEFPGGVVIDLGQPHIKADDLAVHLSDGLSISQRLQLSRLHELNRIFGYDEKGEPRTEIVKSQCQAELSLSLKKGVRVRAMESPFAPIPTRIEADGSLWTEWWNIGGLAKVSIEVPEFSFDAKAASWSASGGILKDGELRFPLQPFKFLLGKLGIFKRLMRYVPDSIPLDNPGRDAGALLTHLKGLLAGSGSDTVQQALDKLLDAVAAAEKRLPTYFMEYLTAPIPDGFHFSIDVLAGGSLKFDLHMGAPEESDPVPIKFLLPAAAPLPELDGFTIRSLSFGLAVGGTIGLIGFDGYWDRFLLSDLLAACLLPEAVFSNEKAHAIANRLTCSELTALLPPEFPIPIPLFYEDLALEIESIVGLSLHSRFQFKKPDGGILGLFGLIGRLGKFLTNEQYLLHEHNAPQGFDLKFSIDEGTIGLPYFIKAKPIKLIPNLPPVSVYDNVARLLDAMKTGNLNYLIEAIPLQLPGGDWVRIGKFSARFGPLNLATLHWCITSEREFKDIVLKDPQARQLVGAADQVLSSLKDIQTKSGNSSALAKGFIIALQGSSGIDGLMEGRIQLGMALTKEGGFQIATQFALCFAAHLEWRIGGGIEVQATENNVTAAIQAQCGIYWDENRLLAAQSRLEIGSDHFSGRIEFGFPGNLTLTGFLEINAAGIAIGGSVTWGYEGSDNASKGMHAHAKFDQRGVVLKFSWNLFGSTYDVKVLCGGEHRSFYASLVCKEPAKELQNLLLGQFKKIGSEVENEINALTEDVTRVEAENIKLDFAGFKTAFAEKLRHAVKGIPGIVDREVDKHTPSYIPGALFPKKKIVNKILKEISCLTDDLNRAANEIDRLAPDAAKQKILDLLGAILRDYKRKNFKIYLGQIPFPRKKIYYPYTYQMPPDLQDQLRNGIDLIEKFETNRTYVLDKKAQLELDQQRKKIAEEIGKNVQAESSQGIPRLKRISLGTELALFKPSKCSLMIVLEFQKKEHIFEVEGNLSDLSGALKSAARSLLKG